MHTHCAQCTAARRWSNLLCSTWPPALSPAACCPQAALPGRPAPAAGMEVAASAAAAAAAAAAAMFPLLLPLPLIAAAADDSSAGCMAGSTSSMHGCGALVSCCCCCSRRCCSSMNSTSAAAWQHQMNPARRCRRCRRCRAVTTPMRGILLFDVATASLAAAAGLAAAVRATAGVAPVAVAAAAQGCRRLSAVMKCWAASKTACNRSSGVHHGARRRRADPDLPYVPPPGGPEIGLGRRAVVALA